VAYQLDFNEVEKAAIENTTLTSLDRILRITGTYLDQAADTSSGLNSIIATITNADTSGVDVTVTPIDSRTFAYNFKLADSTNTLAVSLTDGTTTHESDSIWMIFAEGTAPVLSRGMGSSISVNFINTKINTKKEEEA